MRWAGGGNETAWSPLYSQPQPAAGLVNVWEGVPELCVPSNICGFMPCLACVPGVYDPWCSSSVTLSLLYLLFQYISRLKTVKSRIKIMLYNLSNHKIHVITCWCKIGPKKHTVTITHLVCIKRAQILFIPFMLHINISVQHIIQHFTILIPEGN